MKPAIETFEGITYFHTDQFIHVNRSYESFHLAPHKHDFIEVTYVAHSDFCQASLTQACSILIGISPLSSP